MAYGIQIYDPDTGAVQVDLSSHLTRFLGLRSTGTSDGYFDVPGSGSLFYVVTEKTNYQHVYGPKMSVSGRRISWSFLRSTTTPITFIYGEYT